MTKVERIQRGKKDFQWFQKYYLLHYFKAEPAEFHAELSEIVDTQERAIVAAPREHAKSTILFSKFLHWICYRQRRFVVSIRSSQSMARQMVDELREELETNERIVEDFGNLIGDRKWTESEFVTSNGVKVLARGVEQSMRGIRYRENRPDAVLLDDVEDDENIDNREQRDKLERKINRVILNLIGDGGSFFMIGNIIHRDAVLVRMLKKSDVFVTRTWGCYKDNGKPIWPAVWPEARLAKKKAEIGTRAFAIEYGNRPGDGDQRMFESNWFRRYTDDMVPKRKIDYVGAVDPAIGEKSKNDDTALAVVGEVDGKYFVLSIRMKKLNFNRQLDACFALYASWPHMFAFGVESIAYQKALKQALEEQALLKNVQLPVKEVEDTNTDKLRRLSRLAPMAEQGRILFPDPSSVHWTPDVEKCIEQFEDLGGDSKAHDDGPDVIERAVRLLTGKRLKTRARAWLL